MGMKAVYIQSIGGASGDMLLGALLDLGLPLDTLQAELSKLKVGGYRLAATAATRCEVRGMQLTVDLDDAAVKERMSPRRQLEIVADSALPEGVKDQAAQVLNALWQAEGRVHGEPAEGVELEELGTVDTLVDVVGFVIGLDQLGIGAVYAGPLVLGESRPPGRAGGYANPAPATLVLAAMAGAPIAAESPVHQGEGELTTPTGAAIITALARFERPAMTVNGIGVGLGRKDPAAFPNVVRVWRGETADRPAVAIAPRQGGLTLLETNLDDVTGETLGYAQERLFALGALDVWHTPIQMKKNRPGVILAALLPAELEAAAVELILRETPTLGIRRRSVERYAAHRETVAVETADGPVRVKVKYLDGVAVAAAPEYEDCRRIALATRRPLGEVYREVERVVTSINPANIRIAP